MDIDKYKKTTKTMDDVFYSLSGIFVVMFFLLFTLYFNDDKGFDFYIKYLIISFLLYYSFIPNVLYLFYQVFLAFNFKDIKNDFLHFIIILTLNILSIIAVYISTIGYEPAYQDTSGIMFLILYILYIFFIIQMIFLYIIRIKSNSTIYKIIKIIVLILFSIFFFIDTIAVLAIILSGFGSIFIGFIVFLVYVIISIKNKIKIKKENQKGV